MTLTDFELVMSLHAMFFGEWFCMSRKGGTGGGGWVHSKGANSMAASGLAVESLGWHWEGHFSPLYEWA